MVRVLVVEDGEEYTQTLRRFAGDVLDVTRAGDGPAALEALSREFDLLFLDMRFDRVRPDVLFGDLAGLVERFNGDAVRARGYLEANQGAYVLAAVREAGHALPAVFSYDFGAEPRRWAALEGRYAPVSYLPDNASAAEIRAQLVRCVVPAAR